ncbi:unnamed protein product [Mytilus coruscus]|uniref:Fibronectin type-III domain-containing protein n=1 Tax=Mytilus coruscus TaxID=42192 RepID=A0A6J8BBM6_MYTCO|nr:unnamed protein product [Mytilus coruscus]
MVNYSSHVNAIWVTVVNCQVTANGNAKEWTSKPYVNTELESGMTCTLSNLPTECIPNSVCKSGGDTGLKCTCKSGYYDSNFANIGGSCILEILVDQGCTNNGPSDQCKDLKSQCTLTSGGYKCVCLSYYYNDAGTCTQQVTLNDTCSAGQPTDQCSDPKAECTSSLKCYCQNGHFENSGNVCTQMSGLRVQNLEVPRKKTGEVFFKITWTIPNTVDFINKYQIKITVNGGTAENLIDIVKTENQYNMTNRQPGHTYVVEVISVETASRPGSQTTSVDLQAGTIAGLPQNIILVEVKSRSIKLSWMKPNDIKGILNGYRISLRVEGVCKVEVVYQCTDCVGAQTILPTTCDVQKKVNINSVDANSKVVTTIDGLFPYISYDVWIAAVNEDGYGERNETLVTTDSEAPGKVTNFEIMTPANVFTTMQVSWAIPVLRERNSIIKEYIIKHNISGLYAANILNQHGEKVQKIYFASSKSKGSRHEREESKIGDQYEDLGMDNVSSYQELGAKDSPNVYDQIGRVHTVDKHYENMLP